MARTTNLTDFLTDVADAIRTKKGSQETIQASNFDTEIENLPSGGDLSEYFTDTISEGTNSITDAGWFKTLKKIPNLTIQGTSANYMFYYYIADLPMINMSNVIDMQYFASYSKTTLVPLYNTSDVTSMYYAFQNCSNLSDVPLLDTSKVTNFRNMFQNCPNLTDQSLDNILQMCINSLVGSGKTLARLGFVSTNYPASRIQALSHYQDFIDAGWTIGY